MSSTDQLRSAFNFTLDDLNANQRGELSPRQVQLLRTARQAYHRRVQKASTMTPLVMLFYAVIIAGFLAAVYFSGAYQSLQKALGDLTLPVVGGAAVLLGLYILWIPRAYRKGLKQSDQSMPQPDDALPSVLSVSGKVKTRFVRGDIDYRTIDSYSVIIGNEDFGVTKAQMNAFQNGKPYRIFYVRNGKITTIQSVEAMET